MRLEDVRRRDDLPRFFSEMGYKVGAEIGVYKGEFSVKLCRAGLKVFAVDPYIVYDNYRKHPKEDPYDKLYDGARKLLEPYDCVFIKKTSMDALADIPDGSLDFVYIDGNHSLPYVAGDIYEWNRKVRVGGAVSGHDYFIDRHDPYWIRACHVNYAVDAFEKIFGVKKHIIDKDRMPSWIWIKK